MCSFFTTRLLFAMLIACFVAQALPHTALPTTQAQELIVEEVIAEPTSQSVNPGINDSFLDPELDVESFIGRFEVESREIYSSRDEVLAALSLESGMRVADVGAGTGFYSVAMAKLVGDQGCVYAVDLAPRFVEHIRKISLDLGRENVTPVLCDEVSVRLPYESVDLVFSSDVYHHFEYPAKTLASIHQALKPGGRMVVIDFEKIEGVSRVWTMDHVRANKETVIEEIQAAGFALVGEKKIEGFKENYFLEFRKR